MINFPELEEEEFNEDNLIEASFLEKATKYLTEKNIDTISVYGNKAMMNIKSNQKVKVYNIKQFFVKLCNSAGLYTAINDENLQHDFGFAMLCVEQQPLCYKDLPKEFQLNKQIIDYCNNQMIDHDIKNVLGSSMDDFSLEEQSALLILKQNIRFNSEIFPKLNIKNKQAIKEILKVCPNIFAYIGKMQNDPEVEEFVRNIPLKHGIASLARMFSKNIEGEKIIDPKFKQKYADLFEEQSYYYVHGFYR